MVTSHSLVRVLQRVDVFSALDDEVVLEVVGASASLAWPAGSTVFDAGDEAEGLFVVMSGRVRVVEPASDETVAVFGPGDAFGEQALLRDATHTKRAVATEDSELLVVPKGPLRELTASSPALAAHLREVAAARGAAPA